MDELLKNWSELSQAATEQQKEIINNINMYQKKVGYITDGQKKLLQNILYQCEMKILQCEANVYEIMM